jgi:hypothetical protein
MLRLGAHPPEVPWFQLQTRSHFIILTVEQHHLVVHLQPHLIIFSGLSLTLFVFWILTNDSDTAFSLDNLALFANRFYRRSYLHDESSFLNRWKTNKFPHFPVHLQWVSLKIRAKVRFILYHSKSRNASTFFFFFTENPNFQPAVIHQLPKSRKSPHIYFDLYDFSLPQSETFLFYLVRMFCDLLLHQLFYIAIASKSNIL